MNQLSENQLIEGFYYCLLDTIMQLNMVNRRAGGLLGGHDSSLTLLNKLWLFMRCRCTVSFLFQTCATSHLSLVILLLPSTLPSFLLSLVPPSVFIVLLLPWFCLLLWCFYLLELLVLLS